MRTNYQPCFEAVEIDGAISDAEDERMPRSSYVDQLVLPQPRIDYPDLLHFFPRFALHFSARTPVRPT